MHARRMFCGLLVLVLSLAGSAPAARILWLEAEHFAEHGGWTSDAQFIDQMGSPYLLAVGLGEPVEDARTAVELPAAGKYRLWARTRDWLPEHHPGPFQVLLGARAVEVTFGQSGRPGWQWEDGGVHELSGSVEVRLHDLSGYYGRCDVLVLTSDLDWVPPPEKDDVAELRRKHGSVSPAVEHMPEHDVVVVGGGLAGCTAAVAAARNGASVVLIQNRPMLGGNASPEILVPPVGVWPHGEHGPGPLDPRETGLVEEYRTEGNQRISEGKLYAERLLRFVETQPNLDLFLNTHATGVELKCSSDAPRRSKGGLGDTGAQEDVASRSAATTEERRIVAVLAMDVRTGRRMSFPGRLFIDCTGDGVVGVWAGAEYRHGKEPRSMYHEPWAPEEPSPHTMGNSIKYYSRDTGEPQPFEVPPWAYKFPTCESIGPMRHPRLGHDMGWQWMIELGGLRDTYADAEEIRDDLLRLAYGLFDHVKNHCPRLAERAAGHKLLWVGHVAGKRESRRLIGDYVLTQNDIIEPKLFPDRVAYGGWSVDDHYSGGFFHNGPPGYHHDHARYEVRGRRYSIPLRCLYSRNVDNLMMAGRDISASHLALADTRVMLTCAVIGHAAGTAAGICIDEETTPRGIYRNHLARLQQQLLKEGAYIIGLKADDARDLAPKAAIRASSQRRRDDGQVMAASNVVNGLARAVGEAANAWAPADHDAGPPWIELAWAEPAVFNVVHVVFQTNDLAPERFAVEARQDGAWRQLAEVDDNRHRRHVLGLQRTTASKLRVVLGESAGICEIRVYDEPERVVEDARRAYRAMRQPDRGPWLPWDEVDWGQRYGGTVIDAWDAEPTGRWTRSTYTGPFIGDGYLHDGDEAKGKKSLRFALAPPKPGRYEVRLGYVPYTNRATNTPITIRHADGETSLTIDQRKKPPIRRLFRPLGTFRLDEKSSLTVSNAGTEGYVVVDAVQMVRVDQ